MKKRLAGFSNNGDRDLDLDSVPVYKKEHNKDIPVYISGPMTDKPNFEEDFQKAEDYLKSLGYTNIINMAKVQNSYPHSILEHEDYLKLDFVILDRCKAIYLIDGWKKSTGCRKELERAISNDMIIL